MEPLATVGELELHLQRPVDEDRAKQALQLASGAVRAFCNWDITQQDTTFEVAGNGTIVLTLPTMFLNSVAAVRVNGTVVDITTPGLSWTRRGQLIRMAGWASFSTVQVDCNHGYPPGEIPDLIKLITLEMSCRAMTNPEGLASAKVGAVTRTFAAGSGSNSGAKLTYLDERLLDRYRI